MAADLTEALRAGDLAEVKRLVANGADLHYQTDHDYDTLINAACYLCGTRDERLTEVLEYLISQGVELSRKSSYGESALSVLSRVGRFDAVETLLTAGADERLLRWTPMHRAAAVGSVRDLYGRIRAGDPLEATDRWSRTPFLIALLAGSVDKARVLLDAGANPHAVGHCGTPGLFMPIISGKPATLTWLLEQAWVDVHQTDEHGGTALAVAAAQDDPECVELLLAAGSDVNHNHHGTALSQTESCDVIMKLLAAGADPADANQRVILGLGEQDETPLQAVSQHDFDRGRQRRFGTRNPERIDEPFWHAMIHAGVNGWSAAQRFGYDSFDGDGPVWCADRFGQSLTLLPDGRAVQIGGEHEDYYDPDFCIYNDVFVHEPDGQITVYGYPEQVFFPTDFHTATLIDHTIIVIGNLGYADQRRYGQTPVFRLHLDTWRIEPIKTRGDLPGWLYKHRAELIDPDHIRVSGGTVLTLTRSGGDERESDNRGVYTLDLRSQRWTRETAC